MSYARFSNGDVYVYATGDKIICCACKLSEPRGEVTLGRADMILHLEAHRAAGHDVPEEASDRLRWELEHQQTVFGNLLHED